MNADEDRTLYYILIIMLIVGIVAAIVLIKLQHKEPEPFTALSFNNPDALPNLVRLNKDYNFTYQVQSFENETKEYELQTELELFRLYDVTEEYYSCLSPFRRKVYLDWTNETNLTHANITDTNEIIPDLAILPSKADFLDWRKYYFTFALGRSLGKGEFVIWFGTDNYTNYEFSINQETKELKFNGEVVRRNISIDNENDHITIENTGHRLRFLQKEKVLFDRAYENATDGQFGFETRDMFITLGRMQISKYEEIEVPDKENIWEYSVDTNSYFNWLGQARNQIEKEVVYSRTYVYAEKLAIRTETPATEDIINTLIQNISEKQTPCDNVFACNYLTEKNQSFFVNKNNITALLLSLPVYEPNARFWLDTKSNDSGIPWYDFKANILYESLNNDGSMAFVFNEEFAILFTNNSYSIIKQKPEGITISQYNLDPRKYEKDELKIENFTLVVHDKTVDLRVRNQKLQIQLDTDLFNSTPKVFHLDTFSTLKEIKITSDNDKCLEKEVYDFCRVTYKFNLRAVAQRPPSTNLYGEVIEYGDSNLNYSSVNHSNETLPELNLEQGIPSKQFSFNGPLTRINNKTNLTFGASYFYLGGEGNVKIGVKDINGTELFSATYLPTENKIRVQEGNNSPLTLNKYIDEREWQNVQIDLMKKNNTIIFNRTVIFTYYNDIPDGYFFMETKNTDVELRNVYIRNQATQSSTNIPLLEDPCRLRSISKKVIRKETFTLEPNTNTTFADKITLDSFFDYALVSVSLNGSSGTNNTALKTQFWMVRQ